MWFNKEILFKKFAHWFHLLELTFQASAKVRLTHFNICRCKCSRENNYIWVRDVQTWTLLFCIFQHLGKMRKLKLIAISPLQPFISWKSTVETLKRGMSMFRANDKQDNRTRLMTEDAWVPCMSSLKNWSLKITKS